MQSHLGVLWLVPIAMGTFALLLPLQKLVKCLESFLTIDNFTTFEEFEVIVFDNNAGAVVTHATEGFENISEEALVVDCSRQINVSKVSWIRSTMDVTHTGIIRSSIHWLTVDGRFISSNARWDFPIIDRQCLCDRVLPQLSGLVTPN